MKAVIIINTCNELQAMRNNLTETYQLAGNINCSETIHWNEGQGFEPIGDDITPFEGTLDGQGHTVSSLFIHQPSTYYVGLFGRTNQNAGILSINLMDVNITGNGDVGSVTGWNQGLIANVIVSGLVSSGGVAGSPLAGLVGWNWGLITNVSATMSLFCTTTTSFIRMGGMVGQNDGTINYATATASFFDDGGASDMGGLVSWNDGTINHATAISFMTGGRVGAYMGGLVASNQGIINHATAMGSVSSDSDGAEVGGLVGANSGTINHAIAMGSVSGTGDDAFVGGLVGSNYDTGTINHAMATGSIFSYGDNAEAGGLVGYNLGTIHNTTATGSVTSDGDNSVVGGAVGLNSANGIINTANTTGDVFGRQSVGGLVGQNNAIILNATASGQVSGKSNSANVGGLAGINNGNIIFATATGRVSGNNNVGGLAGLNAGTLAHVKSTGDVYGNNVVGGLVGENKGNISSSYATGLTTGTNSVGGFVGMNSGGIIQNVYATGGATGENNVAGLIGFITNASVISYAVASGCVKGSQFTSGLIGQWLTPPTMTSIYWDGSMMERSQLPDDMAYLDAPPYKRTTEELYRQSTYDNWNFTTTWRINEKHSYSYLHALAPETIPVAPVNPCYTKNDLFGFLLKTFITPLIIFLTFLFVMGFLLRKLINHLTFQSGNLDVCKALPALARLGQLPAVKCICEDVSYSPSDNDVCLALRLTVMSGHIAIVRYLLTKYQTLFDEKIRIAAAETAHLRNYPEIANLLADNYSQTQGTLSFTLVQNQLLQVLKNNPYPWFSMLRFGMQGININILYATDVTPLMLSVQQKRFNTALYMTYLCGADVMMTNSKGETVIDQLIQQGKTLQARQFIEIDSNTSEHWRLAFSVIRQLIAEGKMGPVNLSKWLLDDTDQNPRKSMTRQKIKKPAIHAPSIMTRTHVWIALSFCLDILNRLSNLFLIHALQDQEQNKLANTSLTCFLIAYALDIYGFRTALGYWFMPLNTNGLRQIVMLPVANPGLVRLTWGVNLIDLHLAILKIAHFCVEDIAQWVVIIVFYIQAQAFPSIIWMKVIISSLATITWIAWFIRITPALRQQANQRKTRNQSININTERNSVTMRLLAESDDK